MVSSFGIFLSYSSVSASPVFPLERAITYLFVTTWKILKEGNPEVPGTLDCPQEDSPQSSAVQGRVERIIRPREARHDLNENMETIPYYRFHKESRNL
jgi:hypothetical protein